MADPTTLERQQEAEDSIDKVSVAVSMSILLFIVEKLKNLKGTHSDIYAAIPEDLAELENLVSDGRNAIIKQAVNVLTDMAIDNDEWAAHYYKAAGIDQRFFKENENLKNIIKSTVADLQKEIKANVNTKVLFIEDLDSNVGALKDTYVDIIQQAATKLSAGEDTYKRVVGQAVERLSRFGVRVEYESGTTRELYAAVRTNVMDSYKQALNDIRIVQGLEFGADGVEVSAHVPCARDHEEYQGQQYTFEEWKIKQYEPSRPLIIGANCHHRVYPVILGVSSPTYSQDDVAKMNKESNEIVRVTGLSGKELSMTRYEASQYQRRIEQTLRKTNSVIASEKAFGNDATAYELYAKSTMRHYKQISAQAGLTTRIERTKAYVI